MNRKKLVSIAYVILDAVQDAITAARIRDLELRVEQLEAARKFTIQQNRKALDIEISNPLGPGLIWGGDGTIYKERR